MHLMQRYQKKVDSKFAEFLMAKKKLNLEETALRSYEEERDNIRQAQEITQEVAQDVQQEAHRKIAGVVSRCLTAVFDEPYDFQIYFERKRGRTDARLVFERDGIAVDPMTASGGGVIDVASFALRLSCLCLSQPRLSKVLILDEPFKFLSKDYRDKVRLLLEMLAEDMGVQFIMVTHIQELETGTVITL